jgi:hypothetical protein
LPRSVPSGLTTRRSSAIRRSRSSRSRRSTCSRRRDTRLPSRGTSSRDRRSATADNLRARPRGNEGGTRCARRAWPPSEAVRGRHCPGQAAASATAAPFIRTKASPPSAATRRRSPRSPRSPQATPSPAISPQGPSRPARSPVRPPGDSGVAQRMLRARQPFSQQAEQGCTHPSRLAHEQGHRPWSPLRCGPHANGVVSASPEAGRRRSPRLSGDEDRGGGVS